jgi:hypothetical protein
MEVFNENFILNEKIFDEPLTKKIDKEFDKLLSYVKYKNGIPDTQKPFSEIVKNYENIKVDGEINKILKNIQNYYNKIFNMNIKLHLDTKRRIRPYGFAYILIERSDVEEAMSEIQKTITTDDGYKFLKIQNADIYIEEYLLRFIKTYNDSFSGRNLTAIILHEIGHKLFLKVNCKKSSNDRVKVTISNITGIAILMVSFIVAATDQGNISISKKITGIIIGIISFTSSTMLSSIISIKSYYKTEGNCDNVAAKYGYGKEIYDFFFKLEKIYNGSIVTKRNKIKKLFSADYNRRELIYRYLKLELNDPDNSEETKKRISEILLDIDKKLDNL